MRVLISGAGQVGYFLSERLSAEGHEVVLIDRSQEHLKRAQDRLNVLGILGNGCSAEVLEKAGIKGADIFIAVTDLDEVNILSCLLAREYNVTTRIARVKSIEYSSQSAVLNKEKLGIDLLINPDDAVADEIVKIAGHAGSFDVAEFVGGQIHFVGYRIAADSPICNLTLRELGEIRGIYRFIVTALMRAGQTIIPRGEDTIQAGDSIYIFAHQKDLPAIQYLLHIEEPKKQRRPRAFVLGGRRVGREIAEELERSRFNVKLIEKDMHLCEELAARLKETIVINAESTDINTLKDEGIDGASVYVAVTENDETNILACLLARQHGAQRTIALVNRPELLKLAPSLGIDACVSPRLAAAATILKYVRRGDVVSMAAIEGSDAEVIELMVKEESRLIGTPLKELHLPKGSIIGSIVHADTYQIPTGESVLYAGDRVVIFTLPEALAKVEHLFA